MGSGNVMPHRRSRSAFGSYLLEKILATGLKWRISKCSLLELLFDCSATQAHRFFEEQKRSIQIANDIFKIKETGGDRTRKRSSCGHLLASSREERPHFKPWVVEDYIKMIKSKAQRP